MRGLVAVCVFSFVLAAVLADDAPTKYTGTVRCYVCNSLNAGQGNCTSSDENELKPYLKTCPKVTEGQLLGRSASSCRKIIQDVHEQEATIRECAYTGEDEIDGKRRIGNKGIIPLPLPVLPDRRQALQLRLDR
ncbi:hypothetical protein M3Y99_01478500 [Aphelenchoides fujianensis]|nr:hypothetical protein M3Y99_01478500 [Aphelenchoides fujianensis]